METLDLFANIMILVAWPAAALFVGYYAVKSPWKENTVGRTIMYLAVSLLALLTLGISTNWFDDYYIESIVRAVVYLGVTVGLWRLFVVLRWVQKGRITPENDKIHPIRSISNAMRLKSRSKSDTSE